MLIVKSLRFVLVGLAAALAIPSIAAADGTVSSNGSTITITATGSPAGSLVNVSVTNDTDDFIFTNNSDQALTQGSGCNLSSPTVVKCPLSGVNLIKGTLHGVHGGGLSGVDAEHMTAPVRLEISGSADPGSGSVRLFGGPVADKLTGGDDGDVLIGGDGNDELYGEAGNDHLVGRGGSDLLIGGPGDDYLGFEAGGGDDDNPASRCGTGVNDPGSAGDAMGIDLPGDGDLFAKFDATPNTICTAMAPHVTEPYPGLSGGPGLFTLSATPEAGSTYFAATGITPGGLVGTAPNEFDIFWYLCDGPVPTATGNAVEHSAPNALDPDEINPRCTFVHHGPTYDIPADAADKYLGVVGSVGLDTSSAGPTYAYASYAGAQARLIEAPVVPPAVIPPAVIPPVVVPPKGDVEGIAKKKPSNAFSAASTLTCRSSVCTLRVKAAAGGSFSIKQAGATSAKKTAKQVTGSKKTGRSGKTTALSIKLTSAAKKTLKEKRRLTVRIAVTFKPSGGTTSSPKTVKVVYKLR